MNGGEHAWTAEGRISGQSAAGHLRPELRLAASMFEATPSRADLIRSRFRRSEPV